MAHVTCSLLVIAEFLSATTEMVGPAGIAWANSAALRDAAAALSFRKVRRVAFRGIVGISGKAEGDATGVGEVGFGLCAGDRWCVAGPASGGDPLAGSQAAGARGALIGKVGQQAQQVAGGVGAGALDADRAV